MPALQRHPKPRKRHLKTGHCSASGLIPSQQEEGPCLMVGSTTPYRDAFVVVLGPYIRVNAEKQTLVNVVIPADFLSAAAAAA